MSVHERASLIADSVTTSGERISTLLIHAAAPVISRLQRHGVVCTFPGERDPQLDHQPRLSLITASDFDAVYRDPELADLADAIADELLGSTPEQVGDTSMHSPFVRQAEARFIDLSVRAVISGARCHRLGASSNIYTDIDTYHELLLAGPEHCGALLHPALPAQHQVFAELDITPRVYRGWIGFYELLAHRRPR